MEWCDHCCRFCQTSVESIIDDFTGKYCSSCTMCGKILLDLRTPLQVIFPNKGMTRNSGRTRKRKKSSVKIVNKERDVASKGSLIKEVKQSINSDTTQVFDDC